MKTPGLRMRRSRRLALLRNPPRVKDKALGAAIMAELKLIHDNSRLDGDTKHYLFMRGAKQLSELEPG